MRNQTKVLLLAFTFAITLATAPSLVAQESGDRGMMGREGMMGGRGMMDMMGSMMRMMDHCNRMMQEMPDGSRRPNDPSQNAPSAPDKKS